MPSEAGQIKRHVTAAGEYSAHGTERRLILTPPVRSRQAHSEPFFHGNRACGAPRGGERRAGEQQRIPCAASQQGLRWAEHGVDIGREVTTLILHAKIAAHRATNSRPEKRHGCGRESATTRNIANASPLVIDDGERPIPCLTPIEIDERNAQASVAICGVRIHLTRGWIDGHISRPCMTEHDVVAARRQAIRRRATAPFANDRHPVSRHELSCCHVAVRCACRRWRAIRRQHRDIVSGKRGRGLHRLARLGIPQVPGDRSRGVERRDSNVRSVNAIEQGGHPPSIRRYRRFVYACRDMTRHAHGVPFVTPSHRVRYGGRYRDPRRLQLHTTTAITAPYQPLTVTRKRRRRKHG